MVIINHSSGCDGAGAAERSYPTSKVRGGSQEELLTSKVRGCGQEKLPHVQGKEQWLHFAGAAVKTYPMSKVRETHIRRYVLQDVIRGKTH